MTESDVEVVVVSMGSYSWKVLLDKKFYAFPKSSRKIGRYFAFYRDGAISHYGEVKEAEEGGKEAVGIGYWLHCLPDADPPYQIVRFDKIRKLKHQIKKNHLEKGGYIQGRRYTTLKKLLSAKIISDLS